MTGLFRILIIYFTLLCIPSPHANARINDPVTIISKEEKPPIIYTFFELQSQPNGEKDPPKVHDDMLRMWKRIWREAGWEPRILTLDDAKKHPKFEEYRKKLLMDKDSYEFHDLYENSYNFMCFMRWLAMDANGKGGFMSDYDTFPIEIKYHDGLDLPNAGFFTAYDRFVPNLLSGSADEWQRMTKKIFEIAIRKSKRGNGDYNTDMHVLLDIYEETPDECLWEETTYNGYPYRKKNVLDCLVLRNKLVIHLSHHATHAAFDMGLVEGEYNDSIRPQLVRNLFNDWRLKCH